MHRRHTRQPSIVSICGIPHGFVPPVSRQVTEKPLSGLDPIWLRPTGFARSAREVAHMLGFPDSFRLRGLSDRCFGDCWAIAFLCPPFVTLFPTCRAARRIDFLGYAKQTETPQHSLGSWLTRSNGIQKTEFHEPGPGFEGNLAGLAEGAHVPGLECQSSRNGILFLSCRFLFRDLLSHFFLGGCSRFIGSFLLGGWGGFR